MQVVKEENGKLFTMAAEEKQLFDGIALKILKSLAERQKYPKEMAREIKVHEQNVYYHIRQLERKGFLRVARKEEKGGALAKMYELSSPAFFVRFGDFQESNRVPRGSSFEPFIKNGILDARIVVGSPDPHGPEKARSRDASFAVDFALFLGTFLTKAGPSVIEDKNVHAHDLKSNLIIIGGPVTNKVTRMVNDKLPVKFDPRKNIISKRKIYKHDECGFIAKADSPFAAGKKIIVIAGKRYSGTKAAVLAFMRNFEELQRKASLVVEGLDNDCDGEIDAVRILE